MCDRGHLCVDPIGRVCSRGLCNLPTATIALFLQQRWPSPPPNLIALFNGAPIRTAGRPNWSLHHIGPIQRVIRLDFVILGWVASGRAPHSSCRKKDVPGSPDCQVSMFSVAKATFVPMLYWSDISLDGLTKNSKDGSGRVGLAWSTIVSSRVHLCRVGLVVTLVVKSFKDSCGRGNLTSIFCIHLIIG